MITHQLILPEDTPASSIRRGVMLSPDKINTFLDRLGDAASPVGMHNEKLVDLHHAARILTTIGVNSFLLLRIVLEDELSCYLHEGHLSVCAPRFDRDELEAHIKSAREELGFITQHEIAARLGITLKQVSAMNKAGDFQLVAAFGTTNYFAGTSIE